MTIKCSREGVSQCSWCVYDAIVDDKIFDAIFDNGGGMALITDDAKMSCSAW